jgi:hypothetical protein
LWFVREIVTESSEIFSDTATFYKIKLAMRNKEREAFLKRWMECVKNDIIIKKGKFGDDRKEWEEKPWCVDPT